ncbi:MAG: FAD-dependent thymidylate synthase [Candidatus Omnitrophica bacterium]|nr:FAD-dependent thymidylate synthase [Candidatus Omnitrophota bacterium]
MKVELLSYTNNPKEVIYASARQCYSKYSAYKIYTEKEKISSTKLKEFIAHLTKRGHLSPLEHISFTFAVEGISRVCSHQLVRHRIASYSQQSQRYVSMDNFDFIIPPTIAGNKEAKKIFLDTIDYIKSSYKKLKDIMEVSSKIEKEKINQDLRFLLPQAVETKIVITMNVRELMHFFSERLCVRAQWEIRELAKNMLTIVRKILPEVFIFSGPKCKQLNYCPENFSECKLYKA